MTSFAKLVCVAGVLLLAGCNTDSGPRRIEVSGIVNLNGAPMKAGILKLVPTGNSPNPMSTAEIIEGEFKVTNLGGVAVGDYKVEILSYRKEQSTSGGESFENDVQFLPPEYNKESKLTLSVPEGAEAVKQTFDLEADPMKSY